ncbi:MAG: hypothetical protein ACHP6H_02610 [Legionellales bacterium]
MSFFDKSTTAGKALLGEVTFKPYYDSSFHLAAIAAFCVHVLRTLYYLIDLVYDIVCTPFILVIPLFWLSIPGHCLSLVDDCVGLALSLLTVITTPEIFVIRTLSSLFMGYGEDSSCVSMEYDEEDQALSDAMRVFPQSFSCC